MINSKTFLNEGLNRNLDNKPWSHGSHPEENLGWEKKMTEKSLLILADPTPKRIVVVVVLRRSSPEP